MTRYNHIPVFQDSYRLTLQIHKMAGQFPREHKYALGQQIKDLASELMCDVVSANIKKNKVSSIEEAILHLQQIRIHVRLASDLHIAGLARFEALNRDMENISKQLSGWLDWAMSGAKNGAGNEAKNAL